jgi:hypothetical protein
MNTVREVKLIESPSAPVAQEASSEVAPESVAQLTGAWAYSVADCDKLFQRLGKALTFRQPIDQFAQAAIVEPQRIRLPSATCQLERASHEGGALKVSADSQDSVAGADFCVLGSAAGIGTGSGFDASATDAGAGGGGGA